MFKVSVECKLPESSQYLATATSLAAYRLVCLLRPTKQATLLVLTG